MNLPSMLTWMQEGKCQVCTCPESKRVFTYSHKLGCLFEQTDHISLNPQPALLSPIEQSSQNWSVYRPPVSANWLLTLLSGKGVKEVKKDFEFVHIIRDGVVYSAKLEPTIVSIDDIRNWFVNDRLTEVVFGDYAID